MQSFASFLQKFYKKKFVIFFDALSIPVAWCLAFWMRFNFHLFPHYFLQNSLKALAILIPIQLICYYYFKVYRGLWRYSSINEVIRIIKSVLTAIILSLPLLFLNGLLTNLPRSVLAFYTLLLTTILCGGRLFLRIYYGLTPTALSSEALRVLIIGGGQAGESLVRDLLRTGTYIPIGFLDDSASKVGLEIHGVRVLGTTKDIHDVLLSIETDLIIIAIPSAGSKTMRKIVALCEQTDLPFRTLPSLTALTSGLVQVNSLRDVNIEDLLGRDQVRLEWDKINNWIHNKNIVVTGGGGSIGSELCRQIAEQKPKKLLIIDNSEFNLYTIDRQLRALYPELLIEIKLVSVTDDTAINHHFQLFRPQVVFHAAAFKHVPLLEPQIRAAVKNNVLGTKIIAEAAVEVGVDKFILISTDKAVNPTNIMGASKRVAEIYCQNLNDSVATQFITVRFGNVLGSAGSVVPLFKQQLQMGGPLTVTHPDIERYFMTIPEASQLILQAMCNGSGGEIFVLDMGEPIKIRYLAEQLIQLSGKIPGKDIDIVYTGLRPGEKLFEELFHESEKLTSTAHEKLFKARLRKLDWNELTQTLRLMNTACNRHNDDELKILLTSLVPEFNEQPQIYN